jgi:hypothetical protein
MHTLKEACAVSIPALELKKTGIRWLHSLIYKILMSVIVLSQELILILCIILTFSALLEFHMFENEDI